MKTTWFWWLSLALVVISAGEASAFGRRRGCGQANYSAQPCYYQQPCYYYYPQCCPSVGHATAGIPLTGNESEPPVEFVAPKMPNLNPIPDPLPKPKAPPTN